MSSESKVTLPIALQSQFMTKMILGQLGDGHLGDGLLGDGHLGD